jgi:transcriptional regulator with PAS, ATPase and Fis domain
MGTFKKEIQANKFREDLYYRLAVVELHSPPLRERVDDIPILVQHLIKKFNVELNRRFDGVDPEALKQLSSTPWKGNIRELQNVIERAMLVGSEPLIKSTDLGSYSQEWVSVPSEVSVLKDAVAAFERLHVTAVLQRCAGDKRKAAAELGDLTFLDLPVFGRTALVLITEVEPCIPLKREKVMLKELLKSAYTSPPR